MNKVDVFPFGRAALAKAVGDVVSAVARGIGDCAEERSGVGVEMGARTRVINDRGTRKFTMLNLRAPVWRKASRSCAFATCL